MATTDARPVPRKNTAFRLYFAIRKNDGTLITTWAGQDSEISQDGGAFADCTNEATEIGTSGCGYLELTADEMNADAVVLKVTVTNTDALPIVMTLFPEEQGDYRVGAVELDSATTTKINSILEDTGTTLPAQISGIAGGSGTGARTVTITVNDGATALQNATVRMTEGVNTYTATTNASGVAVFNLDDATYTVGISKAGYSYAGTTIVVDGTETATYSMTAVSVTPGSGDITTGYLTCLNEEGVAEQNVSVRCQVVQIPASGTGFAYDSAVQLATSDADGLVEFPMIKGARYLVWRGSIKPPAGITPVLISAAAGSTTALGSLIGE